MTAAFQATYADFKSIKSRSVVQIVLEVPVEQADHALKVLGGVPKPGESVWVGVARMQAQKPAEPPAEQKERTPFPKLRPSQQASILCRDPLFHEWADDAYAAGIAGADDAAEWVRIRCKVGSRRDLDTDPEAAARWKQLLSKFEDARLGRR